MSHMARRGASNGNLECTAGNVCKGKVGRKGPSHCQLTTFSRQAIVGTTNSNIIITIGPKRKKKNNNDNMALFATRTLVGA